MATDLHVYSNPNAARDGHWDATQQLGWRNTYRDGSLSYFSYAMAFISASGFDMPVSSLAIPPDVISERLEIGY